MEAEDFVACQGFLPERLIGVDGDGRDGDAGVDGAALCEDTDLAGGVTPLRLPPTVAGGGTSEHEGGRRATSLRTNLNWILMCLQHKIKRMLRLWRIRATFRDLTSYERTQGRAAAGKKRKVQNRNPKLQIRNPKA